MTKDEKKTDENKNEADTWITKGSYVNFFAK